MAAHAFTMLGSFKTHSPAAIKHALGYAPGGDTFEFEDWQNLVSLCEAVDRGESTLDELHSLIDALVPEYHQKWVDLGQPRESREWMQARYPARTKEG